LSIDSEKIQIDKYNMADKVIFSVKERVKCYSRGKLYDAKILKVEVDQIKVHYIGWSSTRDEIVSLDKIYKETEGSNEVNESLMQMKEATSDKYTVIDNDEQISRESNEKMPIHDLIQMSSDNSNEKLVNDDLVKMKENINAKQEKCICECGGSLSNQAPYSQLRHSKSKMHLDYVKKLALPICGDIPLHNSSMKTIELPASSMQKVSIRTFVLISI
jgi:CDGSH-type Zn-finger protein